MRTLRVVNLGQVVPGESSVGSSWWTHHIMDTRAYAEAVMANDTPAAIKALKGLWKAVMGWKEITGCPMASVLMAEHTALAKLLADCFATKAGEACTSTAVDAIIRNVVAHRDYFPKDPVRFADLFGRHSELAGAYITDLAARDLESFNQHFAQALDNGQELAAFTDEVLVPASEYDNSALKRGLSGSRIGQKHVANYITTGDFSAYVRQANESLKTIADIARAHDLSSEELQTIGTELGKVAGFTIPMANIETPEGPSPWLAAAGGLLLGGLIGTAL